MQKFKSLNSWTRPFTRMLCMERSLYLLQEVGSEINCSERKEQTISWIWFSILIEKISPPHHLLPSSKIMNCRRKQTFSHMKNKTMLGTCHTIRFIKWINLNSKLEKQKFKWPKFLKILATPNLMTSKPISSLILLRTLWIEISLSMLSISIIKTRKLWILSKKVFMT